MSLDATAIREIQQSATTQHLNKELDYERVLIAPENFKPIDMEKFQSGRSNYRGEFNTASLKAFGEYCEEHDPAEVISCYINSDQMSAKVIFDQGDSENPGHCQHVATLSLDKTPEYKALLRLNGESMNQKDFAEWFEDWRDHVIPFGETTTDEETGDEQEDPIMPIGKAIAAIRRVKIKASAESTHAEGDFKASSSRMGEVSAASEGGNVAGFTFKCVPYTDLPEVDFNVRVSILLGGEKPVFKARVRQIEKCQIVIAENFEEKLRNELASTCISPVIGTFNPGR
ncbi:DUF2303 family protein [Oceanobacter sp. 3_MG-2023]|uniref:DUF2303 family protein n=1 Tax=Oceanobacter sp. 3_MG-2023 TaxID=3062622 RepID=UPI002732D239|nr:DUF2303 family protein [Oceanobacter sp. 3_MG-2023]MDP2505414.1 DUF2303 family protein [Oceanobacter sp. 3_MG-2023]